MTFISQFFYGHFPLIHSNNDAVEHKNGNYKIFSNMQQHQQMLDPIKENMSLIKFNNFAAHTRSHLQNIKKNFPD